MTMFFEPDDYDDEVLDDEQNICCPECDSDHVALITDELTARVVRPPVIEMWYRCMDCGYWWMES